MRVFAKLASAAYLLPTIFFWSAPVTAHESIRDARGIEVNTSNAERIVSIGGSVTEIIFALGEQTRIVAIDTTSTFPETTEKLPNVGYMRALSPEGILSTDPTLILAIDGAGPVETIDVLADASVPFVMVPNDFSLAGIVAKIRFISNVLGVREKGEALIREIEGSEQKLKALKSEVSSPLRVMFVLSLRDGSVLAAGQETQAAAIIELAGAENAMQSFEGFKRVDAESIIQAAPEVILMMNIGNRTDIAEEVFEVAAIAATPAGANRRLIMMDGLYLLGFGPRTPDAVRALAENLYNISGRNE